MARDIRGNVLIEYHRGLLLDELRTNAYRDAIHRLVRPGDVVIDLGSGSGILSFFACEAGAAKVFAIEQGHMADVVRLLAKHARLDRRIEVFHDESTQVELPQRADVLVTETIGAFGFDEQIVSALIDARARLLHPGARFLPGRLLLSMAPIEIPADYQKTIAFWSERRYGVDFSPLRALAASSPQHLHVAEDAWLAGGVELMNVDLSRIDSPMIEGHARFTARRDGIVHGFAAWFTATLFDGITLTNRLERGTHWSQGFLPLEVPINVTRGARIELEVDTDDGRSWGWRGRVAGTKFDQHNGFSMPPCVLARKTPD